MFFDKFDRSYIDPRRFNLSFWDRVGDVLVTIVLEFLDEKFALAWLFFASSDFDRMKGALRDRYGDPTTLKSETFQTRLGARYENAKLQWIGNSIFIELQQYTSTLKNSSAGIGKKEFFDYVADRERKKMGTPRKTFRPGAHRSILPDTFWVKVTEMKILALLAFATLVLASGCSNRATATLVPGADIGKLKTFYVAHQPKDKRNLHQLISDKLVLKGFRSSAGPALPMSEHKVDAVVTYVDRWMWDMTMYLLELTVTLREPANGQQLAIGNSFHTSLTRLSPEEMIDEVLANIFKLDK